MASFVDNSKREWTVRFTNTENRRLRDALGVNLPDGFDLKKNEHRDIIAELADPLFLADVLYVICRPQCDERGVSDEEFGESLIGDVIDDATTALLEALCDFFPKKKRVVLRALLGKVRTRMDAAEMPSDDDLDKILDAAMSQYGSSAGSLADSPESIPTAVHSAN